MNLHQIAISLGLTVTGLVTQIPIVTAQATASNSGDHPQKTCVVYNDIDVFQGRYLYSPLPVHAPPPPDSGRSNRSLSKTIPPTEAEMRRAIELNPTDMSYYSQLTNFLDEADRQDEAIAIYRQWIQNAPSSRLPYLRLGNVLLGQGEFDEAIRTYQEALEIQLGVDEEHLSDILSSSRFYIAIGDLLQLQRKEPASLESYALGVEQNVAATTIIYGILGSTYPDDRNYQRMLDVQQAERIYRRLIQRFPNTAFGYYRLTELLVSKNRFDEAISLYRAWIPRIPDPPIINDLDFNIRPDQYLTGLMRQKAIYLRDIGDFDEAIATYREILEVDSSSLFDRVDLAMVLVEQGDLEAAANEYRQLIAENPNRGTLYIALGNIFECQGYTARANLAYIQATSLRTSELPAYHFLGNFLLEQRRFEEAARAYRTIFEIHHSSESGRVSPEDFQRYDNLFRQQRWQEATSLYQNLVESMDTQINRLPAP